jgi:hypothetical protein
MVNHIESNIENATEYALNALSSVKTAEAAKRRNLKVFSIRRRKQNSANK